MTVKDTISKQLTEAMKAKDEVRLATLRQLKTEILKFETEAKGKVCGDADLLTIAQRLKKQREESIDQFEKAGRAESAAEERAQLAILEEFLPKAMSEAELEAIVKETVAEVGATSAKEIGQVMKAIMPKLGGRADGKMVNQKVREALT